MMLLFKTEGLLAIDFSLLPMFSNALRAVTLVGWVKDRSALDPARDTKSLSNCSINRSSSSLPFAFRDCIRKDKTPKSMKSDLEMSGPNCPIEHIDRPDLSIKQNKNYDLRF